MSTAANLAFSLLSGIIGAAIASYVSWRIQQDTKAWTLHTELKRYRIERVTGSVQALRLCFYRAKTNLDYWHQELVDHDDIIKGPYPLAVFAQRIQGETAAQDRVVGEAARLVVGLESERLKHNTAQSSIQAEAASHVAILVACDLPLDILAGLQAELRVLSDGRTSDAASVQRRIELYEQHEPVVLQLLTGAERFAEALIGAK